jgi:cytochrome c oxidase subunit IV
MAEPLQQPHSTSVKTYALTALALLVLTIITVAVAFIDLGVGILNDLVAMAIATTKAGLIVYYFMHARFSRGMTRVFIYAGIIWVGFLIVGIMNDYVTRDWIPFPGR